MYQFVLIKLNIIDINLQDFIKNVINRKFRKFIIVFFFIYIDDDVVEYRTKNLNGMCRLKETSTEKVKTYILKDNDNDYL